MKIAVVYNRESRDVINLFGTPNQEKIGIKTIKRITDSLKQGGHQVKSFEGDKELIVKLGDFMPRVVKGERPGMVFNVSYGIQGQARYTHVPSILEMVGIPYVGSGPLAHSLALDKVVSKMIFREHGIPTAEFAVLERPDGALPDLEYPLIVKPKNEAVSFGIKICQNEEELREAAGAIFEKFNQHVLVERYIDGKEVNVGVLGNAPAEALPPVELRFGEGGPKIYTYEDKTRRSGRTIEPVCPAPIGDELTAKVQEIAKRAFHALGCYDCARVDIRLDAQDNPYVLEVNSLPSLGEHGSYVEAAAHMGLDFAGLVNRLVEVASARYFGTPVPARIDLDASDPDEPVFRFVASRRERLEKRLGETVGLKSRTNDLVGLREYVKVVGQRLTDAGLRINEELTDENVARVWETPKGLEDGTLLVLHLDVPIDGDTGPVAFRRDPEWLYGEGIATKASVVMVEYALRALKSQKLLRGTRLGVVAYTDEGRDAIYSTRVIRAAAEKAARVLVLRPGGADGQIYTARRGIRKYQFVVQGKPQRLGQSTKKPEVLRWTFNKLEDFAGLSSRRDRVAVSAVDVRTSSFPLLLPHQARTTVLMSYGSEQIAEQTEEKMRILLGKSDLRWDLEVMSDRPPMRDRQANQKLAKELIEVAKKWDIPVEADSSLWPSVAGVVPQGKPVLCGLGAVVRDLWTPQEAVHRMTLLQRTLLLAQFLSNQARAERPPRESAKTETEQPT